ncbi:MAG: hypothetical protein RIR00_2158, partial [Pseudomonadota bacterium]
VAAFMQIYQSGSLAEAAQLFSKH